MAQVRRDFQRRGKVETFAWARVEPMGNGIQLWLGIAREIGALRQVLTEQAIRVLVGPPLPGTMRIGKKTRIARRLASCSCAAISFPRLYVRVFRSIAGTGWSFFVKPWRALVASVPVILARMTRRVVRSTRVPTADLLRVPLRRSHSQ